MGDKKLGVKQVKEKIIKPRKSRSLENTPKKAKKTGKRGRPKKEAKSLQREVEQLPEQLEEEREEEEDLDVESVGNFGMMSDPGSFKSNDSLILDDEDVDELNEIVNSKVDITLD